jgi:hypothetical protein
MHMNCKTPKKAVSMLPSKKTVTEPAVQQQNSCTYPESLLFPQQLVVFQLHTLCRLMSLTQAHLQTGSM